MQRANPQNQHQKQRNQQPQYNNRDKDKIIANPFEVIRKRVINRIQEQRQIEYVRNTPLPCTQQSDAAFTLKVVSSKQNILGVGIIDSQQPMAMKWSDSNAVIYTAWNGKVMGDRHKQGIIKQQGRGYRQGDTLSVTLSMSRNTISWAVNGKVQAWHQSELLGNREIQWMPYIRMFDYGDQIYWAEQSENDKKTLI